MGQPVAKSGDQVVGLDTHIVMIPSPGGPIPTPMPLPFSGHIDGGTIAGVFVDDKEVAVEGSTATNQPHHIPAAGQFQKDPSNKATIKGASSSVFAGDHGVARNLDGAECCNDPADQQTGNVVASGSVFAD